MNTWLKKTLWAGSLMASLSAAHAESWLLTDTIQQGSGDINLLTDVSVAQLEALRQAHGDKLVFGVDINEASNGTEKATTQAVTVADAWIEVVNALGATVVYGHAGNFWTETQAMVSDGAATDRATYYTLLGETGSSRISSSNSIQSVMDSTLKFNVPDSLTGATRVMLYVRLLDTNTKLGDPEAFYDYTAGFEDMAVLDVADATYLDTTLLNESEFRQTAPGMALSPEGEATASTQTPSSGALDVLAWVYQPSADGYYFAAFEDLYPNAGDYDFNDLVVAYQYRVGMNADGDIVALDADSYIVARGAVYSHDFTLGFELPTLVPSYEGGCTTLAYGGIARECSLSVTNSRLNWKAFTSTAQFYLGPLNNTRDGAGFEYGPHSSLSIRFAEPMSGSLLGEGSPEIFIRDTGQIVGLTERDERGYPFAMILPDGFSHPSERTNLGEAYPEFVDFMGSRGTQRTDWHSRPVPEKIFDLTGRNWQW